MVDIHHDTFAITLTLSPVPLILANTLIVLLSDSVLAVVFPASNIGVRWIFTLWLFKGVISIGALSTSVSVFELTIVGVSILVGSNTFTREVARSCFWFAK